MEYLHIKILSGSTNSFAFYPPIAGLVSYLSRVHF